MKRPQENNHHIIWKSLVNEYRIDMPENQLKMSVFRHEALHKLFWVLLTPREQLKEMYYIYESVLSDTSKAIFKELLSKPDEEFYIKWIVRKNGRAKQ